MKKAAIIIVLALAVSFCLFAEASTSYLRFAVTKFAEEGIEFYFTDLSGHQYLETDSYEATFEEALNTNRVFFVIKTNKTIANPYSITLYFYPLVPEAEYNNYISTGASDFSNASCYLYYDLKLSDPDYNPIGSVIEVRDTRQSLLLNNDSYLYVEDAGYIEEFLYPLAMKFYSDQNSSDDYSLAAGTYKTHIVAVYSTV